MTKRVAVIVGSLRKASWNRKIALELIKLAPASLTMEIIEIGQLAQYNQDLEEHSPQAWVDFRNKIKSCDALLFVTPEYNRSIPAALKNALDVGSRPYGQSVWNNKPGAIVSASIGAIAGFGANHHLRQTFVFLNIPCMQQPEAYLGNIEHSFEDDQNTAKPEFRAFLGKYMAAYQQWVEKLAAD